MCDRVFPQNQQINSKCSDRMSIRSSTMKKFKSQKLKLNIQIQTKKNARVTNAEKRDARALYLPFS